MSPKGLPPEEGYWEWGFVVLLSFAGGLTLTITRILFQLLVDHGNKWSRQNDKLSTAMGQSLLFSLLKLKNWLY